MSKLSFASLIGLKNENKSGHLWNLKEPRVSIIWVSPSMILRDVTRRSSRKGRKIIWIMRELDNCQTSTILGGFQLWFEWVVLGVIAKIHIFVLALRSTFGDHWNIFGFIFITQLNLLRLFQETGFPWDKMKNNYILVQGKLLRGRGFCSFFRGKQHPNMHVLLHLIKGQATL